MINKIKRYRLGVSRSFPKTHPRAGEENGFVVKIQNGLGKTCKKCREIDAFDGDCCGYIPGQLGSKIHTIRANYPFWEKRMKEVQAGRAVIELFYWSGSPYNSKRDGSKQVVFATLDKDSGCGVQKVVIRTFQVGGVMILNRNLSVNSHVVAKNDGLSLEDFKAWFKGYDLSKPMAIILFTGFRY